MTNVFEPGAKKSEDWEWEINAGRSWFRWELASIGQYKDLLLRLVRRDLLANYQQTVLGPLWILLQPVLTTLVYWIIFGQIVKVSTDGAPALLFYLTGIIIWNFFSDCLNGTMYTFFSNAAVFSKVYFPRLIVPFSNVIAQSVRLAVQLLLFFIIYVIFFAVGKVGGATGGAVGMPSAAIWLLPLLVLQTALFGLGAGLIISVITAKYRDLDYTFQFILRLWMFACPVVYPASLVPGAYRFWFWLNPLTPVIETFRAACFTHEAIRYGYLLASLGFTGVILVVGLAVFKRYELTVMDVI